MSPQIEHAVSTALRYAGARARVQRVTLEGMAPDELIAEIRSTLSQRFNAAVEVEHVATESPLRVVAVEFKPS